MPVASIPGIQDRFAKGVGARAVHIGFYANLKKGA